MQTLINKQIPEINIMHCPLCGMPQEGFVNGMILNKVKGIFEINPTKWYAFCNCRNVFFTDWSNMEQNVYDEEYQKKYVDIEVTMGTRKVVAETLADIPKKDGLFLEIGVVSDLVLDQAKEIGFEVMGLDINDKTESKHLIVVGNAEDEEFKDLNVIWASHVVEHFKDPIGMIKKFNEWLNVGGCLFVAMPDPWMMPLEKPNLWAHWHYREHHTLWDMDSFIDMCIENGFELVKAKRVAPRTEYRIIMRKVK